MNILRELDVKKNDDGQRLDRFLLKYLNEAPRSFIFKMVRKKNIKLNDKKIDPEASIKEGDKIQIYLSEDTIDKFRKEKDIKKIYMDLNVLYEDDNIIAMNKKSGVLSHSTENNREKNVVDAMVSYLIEKGDYSPRTEHNFIPGICNRLDRNTSGIVIGGKNYESMKDLNASIREFGVGRFYKTIVAGKLTKEIELVDYVLKDEEKNKVAIVDENTENAKKIITRVKPLQTNGEYTMLEIEIVTGRTHQIRVHLSSIGHPIIGDRKYGDKKVNKYFDEKFKLRDQYLHGYKITFDNMSGKLKYLNGTEIESETDGNMKKIENSLFRN